MPPFGPIKRSDLIYYLRKTGFQGPFAGTRHAIMARGTVRIRIPNPHQGDINVGLLGRILKQAGIERREWETL